MSVLIKGMKMPKTCVECDFCHWSNLHQTGMCDRCNDEPVCADFGTDYKKTRARFCPLVEIPTPHGRMIEEPKQFDYSGLAYIEPLDFRKIAEYFANQVKAQPTVIEAEEEQK